MFLRLFCCLCCLPVTLLAQTPAFNAADKAFFEENSAQYQRWLDRTGLGATLRTDQLQVVHEDTELELWLVFNTHDPDTAAAQWSALKQQFKTQTGHDLSRELFRKFVYFMEIPPQQGSLQLYLKAPGGGYNKCLYVFMWEEDGIFQSDEKLNDCRHKPFKVKVAPLSVQQIVKGKKLTSTRQLSATETFDGIMSFARSRYLKPVPDRRPEIRDEKRTPTRLSFAVEDLCNEVLENEQKSWWCKLVEACGGVCNDVTRERLEFEFEYDPSTGALHCDVTGKFGSGVYKPRSDKAWMNMEPDFEDFLERYAAKIGPAIEAYLKKP